jgi:hypothetical protein
MKFLLCIINILTINIFVFSQYSNALPSAGKFSYNCTYDGFLESYLLEKSPKNIYEFSFLSPTWSLKEVYQKANLGKHAAQFPKAQLVHLKTNNLEEYCYVKDGSLYSMGFVQDVAFTKDHKLTVKYFPHRRLFFVNGKKGNRYSNNYTAEIRLSKNDCRNIFFQDDSIKYSIVVSEQVIINGEGPLNLSTNSHQVQRHDVAKDVRISIKSKKFGSTWKDNIFASTSWPKELQEIFPNGKYEHIFFLAKDMTGVFMEYDIINDDVKNFKFQQMELSPLSYNIDYDDANVIAHPNPTTGPINFELFNYPFGNYRVEVYNLVGMKISSKEFSTSDGRSLKADFSSLKKGTYMYSIFDQNNKKITTKRMVIIDI